MTHVIIHAGLHKSGTTSLQRFLEINAAILAPRTPVTSRRETTSHESFEPASALLRLLNLPTDLIATLKPAKHLNRQLDTFEKSKLQDYNAQDMTDTELSQIKRRFLRKRRNRKKWREND